MKIIFVFLLFLGAAMHAAHAQTKCPVDAQVTTKVPLTISTNTSNIVLFQLAFPDEANAAGNTITSISFSYEFGACTVAGGPLSFSDTFPDPSVDAISVASAEPFGTSGWKMYRSTATSPCDTVYIFRELSLNSFLDCLDYQTKTLGDLVYATGAAASLSRTYAVSQSLDGLTTSTTNAVVQDLYEFTIKVQEQYNFELSNVQADVELMGDPINPDGNAIIKSVSVTPIATDRKFSITLTATSMFPFELRTGAGATDTVQLASNAAWSSATIQVLSRCPVDYDLAADTCVQDVLIEITSPACSWAGGSLAINIANTELLYGCSVSSGLSCPLANASVETTNQFVSATPITITLNTGSTCQVSTTFNFDAALQATLTSVNGLIASGESRGPWDNTPRKRYLFKPDNHIYFNVEVTNVATVTVISWVDISQIEVKPNAGGSNFSAPWSYYVDTGITPTPACNTTVSINGNNVYRTCAIIPIRANGFTAFTQPSDNSVEDYSITVYASVYLRDQNAAGGTKRAALAFDVVPTRASTSIALTNKADSAGSTTGGASSTTVAIAASVGVVGAIMLIALAVVLVVVFKTKAAVSAASAAPLAAV